MTEPDWLGCLDPRRMLNFIVEHPSGTDRKMRLFTVACYWLDGGQYPLADAEMNAVEQYADRLIGKDELLAAHRAHFQSLFPEDPEDSFGIVEDTVEFAYSAMTYSSEIQAAGPAFFRDIFGNPFRPVTLDPIWQTATVVSVAQAIYDDRAFDRMPILADALEDAGCTNADVLNHCRQPGEHVRGCWVVDLLLAKQ